MRIDAFRPAEEFKAHMDQWITRFRTATPIEGHEAVLIPGDPERETEAIRRKEGIPLIEVVAKDLMEISDRFDIPLSR